MHIPATIIGAALAFSAQASALGINCRGSSNCGLAGAANLDGIINAARIAGDNHVFQNGEHVACVQGTGSVGGSLCAFPQGTLGGIQGWKAKQLLGFIKEYNCGRCGSVPVNFPNDNNVDSAGQLTVNWVQ